MLQGEMGKEEEKLLLRPTTFEPLRLWSQMGQGGAGSAMAATRVGARVNVTRTAQRGATGLLSFFMLTGRMEAKLCCTVAAVFHISTLLLLPAAILSGH